MSTPTHDTMASAQIGLGTGETASLRLVDGGDTMVLTFPGQWAVRAIYPANESKNRKYTSVYIERLES